MGYVAAHRAIILFERGLGTSVEDLARRWGAGGTWRESRNDGGTTYSGSWPAWVECSTSAVAPFPPAGDLRGEQRAGTSRQDPCFGRCVNRRSSSRSSSSTVRLLDLCCAASDGRAGLAAARQLAWHRSGSWRPRVCDVAQLAKLEVDDLVQLGLRRDLARQIRTRIRADGLREWCCCDCDSFPPACPRPVPPPSRISSTSG